MVPAAASDLAKLVKLAVEGLPVGAAQVVEFVGKPRKRARVQLVNSRVFADSGPAQAENTAEMRRPLASMWLVPKRSGIGTVSSIAVPKR